MPKICYTHKKFSTEKQEKINLVNDILEEYRLQGFQLTLRQVYYQCVARGYIPNNDKEYNNLGTLVNDARMAGLIDWDLIIDLTRSLKSNAHWSSPIEIIRAATNGYYKDKWRLQKHRVEVWIEKDAGVSIISPTCRGLDIPFFSCRGYTGQAAMWQASQRLVQYVRKGQRPVILHLGDHDPSGIDMSRDIEERLDHFINTDLYNGVYDYDEGTDHDSTWDKGVYNEWYFGIKFERLALNWDQIELYNPPPNPAKITDSRAAKYIEQHGEFSWELDALNPNTVEGILSDAINPYIDQDLWDEVIEEEQREKWTLRKVHNNWDKVIENLIDE